MKIVAISAWVGPVIYTRKNRRDANRLARRLKNEEQKKTEVLTEKEFRDGI